MDTGIAEYSSSKLEPMSIDFPPSHPDQLALFNLKRSASRSRKLFGVISRTDNVQLTNDDQRLLYLLYYSLPWRFWKVPSLLHMLHLLFVKQSSTMSIKTNRRTSRGKYYGCPPPSYRSPYVPLMPNLIATLKFPRRYSDHDLRTSSDPDHWQRHLRSNYWHRHLTRSCC